MRISDGYFRRLLHHTPATEALEGLASCWGPRVRSDHPRLALSESEHDVHVVLLYLADVGAGGHPQFFHGQPPGMTVRLASALRSLRLRDLSRAFAEACCLLPGDVVGSTPAELDRAMAARVGQGAEGIAAIDERVWRAAGVEATLLQRLRGHEDDLLRPERGLPPAP